MVSYAHPETYLRMRSLDEQDQRRHRILEIHFVAKEHQIGGFTHGRLKNGLSRSRRMCAETSLASALHLTHYAVLAGRPVIPRSFLI